MALTWETLIAYLGGLMMNPVTIVTLVGVLVLTVQAPVLCLVRPARVTKGSGPMA